MLPEFVGRYQIKKELGRGGMAIVYHAYDPQVKRDVAIKQMNPTLVYNSVFRTRFEREVQAIVTLEHAAIVPVYDFGSSEDELYLVMRLMSGGSLLDLLLKQVLDPAGVLPILQRIGAAIDDAHRQGIIHRDLKPANILFDSNQKAFLSDFGIAKLLVDSGKLTSSSLLGTPAYMSPEQIQSEEEIDGRADIYSLGVLLFQMMTGHLPYRAESAVQLMMKHLTEEVPLASLLRPELPKWCDGIIRRAMAKNRQERFNTVHEMIEAFQRALQPALPSPITPLPAAATIIEKASPPPMSPPATSPTLLSRYLRYRERVIPIAPRPHTALPTATIPLPAPPEIPAPPPTPKAWQIAQSLGYRAEVENYQQRVMALNQAYATQLAKAKESLQAQANQQRQVAEEADPSPAGLPNLVEQFTFWERRPGQATFLQLRLGTGFLPTTTTIVPPAGEGNENRKRAAYQLANEFALVEGMPLTIPLNKLPALWIMAGQATLGLLYTLLAQAMVHHAPDDLQLFIFSHHPDGENRWGWAKWLPHSAALDDSGRRSRLAFGPEASRPLFNRLTNELQQRLNGNVHLGQPHLLIIADHIPELLQNNTFLNAITNGHLLNTTILWLDYTNSHQPPNSGYLWLDSGGKMNYQPPEWLGSPWQHGQAEITALPQMELLARKLAAFEIVEQFPAGESTTRLIELLGSTRPDQLDLAALYNQKEQPRLLLGLTENGTPLSLGLDHHLLVTGQDEEYYQPFLQALVLGLAGRFSPKQLHCLLIDFSNKNHLLQSLRTLPHVNHLLMGSLPETVQFATRLLANEWQQRQSLFSAAGQAANRPVSHIQTYNDLTPLAPLPYLVILIDGVESGCKQNSELGPLLTGLAPAGSNLGLQLILATPKIEDKNLAFWPETMVTLPAGAVPFANYLSPLPGWATLQQSPTRPGLPFKISLANAPFLADQLSQFTIAQVKADGRRQVVIDQRPKITPISEADLLIQQIIAFHQA